MELEKPLRRYWDMHKYLRIEQAQGTHAEADEAKSQLKAVDECIDSSTFWARILTLNELGTLVRKCFHWAETCPCHGHLDRSLYPADVVQQWDKCPLRGCRLPELASGCFFKNFADLYNTTVAQLYLKVSEDGISDACRAECMREFENGRVHLIFVFTLKLAAFQEAPLHLFAIGHYDETCSREAWG